jgi:hypothetical protein
MPTGIITDPFTNNNHSDNSPPSLPDSGEESIRTKDISDRTDEELLETEEELLHAFLKAAGAPRPSAKVIIRRDGEPVFAFRIQAQTEEEFSRIRENNTRKRKDNRTGLEVPIKFDVVAFNSEVIYWATIPSDRRLLWENVEAQRAKGLGAISGAGKDAAFVLIDRMLNAGEKAAVVTRIEEISGFGVNTEAEQDELLKGSSS